LQVFSLSHTITTRKIIWFRVFVHYAIHFEKAFDTLYRDALRYRLLLNNVNGNRFNVINIVNMYEGTKSCIMYKDSKSDYFPCSNGVRQGQNLQSFPFFLHCILKWWGESSLGPFYRLYFDVLALYFLLPAIWNNTRIKYQN
jgi:hypothetical protein